MTTEEIIKLDEDERNKCLRKPIVLKDIKREELFQIHSLFKLIIDDIIRNSNRELFLNSMFGKRKIKSFGETKIKKLDTALCSFKLTSIYGEGFFFDARKLFQNNQYPKWITPQYCFNNTHLHVLQTGLKSKILSGIAFVGKPFLHSVLLVGDNIIDFNYDLVMSKDLYCKLTSFEVLEELDSEKLLEYKDLIVKNKALLKDMQSYLLNFAFDETIEILLNRIKEEKNISSY